MCGADLLIYYVYRHVNKINGKQYFGITKRKPESRWLKGLGYKNQPYFYNAILKYGLDNFEHEILFENLTEQEAKVIEIKLIESYKTLNKNFGYNQTAGGDGTNNPSKEMRYRIGTAMRGKHRPLEVKNKISDGLKIAYEEGRKDKIVSQESRNKISNSLKEYYKTHTPWNKGKKASEETRKKLSEVHKKHKEVNN